MRGPVRPYSRRTMARPPSSAPRGPIALATVVLASVALLACSDGTTDPAGGDGSDAAVEDYAAELAAACTAADAALDALPSPPEEISPDDFAGEVARVLEEEAEAARLLRPPDDLADDHRAFVRNTDDQVRAWRTVAETVGTDPDAMSELSTQILELSLGRDDLSTEMGVDACRRDDR